MRGGLPIPASAQGRVRQFFVKLISAAPAAARSGGSPSTMGASAGRSQLCVRPKDLQDTKQLHEVLGRHVKTVLVIGACKDTSAATALVSAAIQLVAEAAHQVARQQVVEKNSSAYSVLLDEGYRAGELAVLRCAVLCVVRLSGCEWTRPVSSGTVHLFDPTATGHTAAHSCSFPLSALTGVPLQHVAVSGFARPDAMWDAEGVQQSI